MIVLQTVAVAFAMFSAVPVPQFNWTEKNMRYAMCAFPLIGVVIGLLWFLCGVLPLPGAARAAGFCLIPVWVTGGIHLDGYADTCDALSSYGDREKKLEILKDPHCGAFAVIRLCSYFLAYFALCTCVSFTPSVGVLWVLALVLERALSGLAVASFPMAKNTGLAHLDFMGSEDSASGGGVEQLTKENVSTEELLKGTKEPLDVFSYHYYNGVSDRLASVMPSAHWAPEKANSEEYLYVPIHCAKVYAPIRDKYAADTEMWVTESGDAGGGGDTWASTYLDVLRTLNELAGFSTVSNGVIFHNTLAASDYGFLAREVFDPRPNYFAVLLWNRLMGTTCYDTKEPVREGAHVYAHSRKDGKPGFVYLVINNSLTETTEVELPKEAERYTLAGQDGNMRATIMTLNDKPLVLGEDNALPDLSPVVQPAGQVELAPGTCTFFVL